MLKKEDRLVRYCCRLRTDKDSKEKIIRILSPDLNWAYFLEKSNRSGVTSLIYNVFSENNDIRQRVPEAVLGELKTIYHVVLGRNILIYQTLENIANSFSKEGIPFLVFKGVSLAESVYKNLGLRPMGDVDILVKIQDVPKADRILDNLGYKKPFIFNDFSRLSYSAYRNSFLYHKSDAYPSHVHLFWHIVNLFPYNKDIVGRIDMDKIWNDSIELAAGDITVRIFSLYHQIIYLCMHALTHLYKPFMLLCDISELVHSEKEKIDWDCLIRETVNFGLSKYVYYGLYFAREILGADIPSNALSRLKPRRISVFEQMFIRRVLYDSTMLDERYALFLLYLGMNETASQRFRYLRNMCFPPKKELSIIKQKAALRIPMFDYMKRILFGG